MVRPQKKRYVAFNPEVSYFKPRGIPMFDLEEVQLTVDERESIRLADLMDFSHEEAGQRMGVSRATFGRIVQRARKIVADALINGKAIRVEGGRYKIVHHARVFACGKCEYVWEEPSGTGHPMKCPKCQATEIFRTEPDSDSPGADG